MPTQQGLIDSRSQRPKGRSTPSNRTWQPAGNAQSVPRSKSIEFGARKIQSQCAFNWRYNMDSRAVRSGPDFQVAAKLTYPCSDAVATNVRVLLLTFCTKTVVSDHQVQ